MKNAVNRFLSVIASLIRWFLTLFGLVFMSQMISREQNLAALFILIGALIMCPLTGKKVLGFFKRPWIGVVLAGLLMFVVPPLIEVKNAPTPEEAAAIEQRRAIAKAESEAREAARAKERAEEALRKEEEKIRKKCNDDVGAFVMSQSFVKDALRAPATAKFPSFLDSKVTVTSPCNFRVVSYVDAQNGFGALIRNRYVADLEVDPLTDRWRLKGLQMN